MGRLDADSIRYFVVSMSMFTGGFVLVSATLYYRMVWHQRSWRIQTAMLLVLLQIGFGLLGDAWDTVDHYGEPISWRVFVYPPSLVLLIAISALAVAEYRVAKRFHDDALREFRRQR